MASNAVQLALGALAAAAVGVGVVWLVPSPDRGETDVTEIVDEVAPEIIDETEEVQEDFATILPTVGLRIDSEGFATIVGRWNADRDIDVLLDGVAFERVQTDQSGNYALVTQIEPSLDARILSVVADPEGEAVASVENPLIRPVEVALAPAQSEEELVVGAVTAEEAEEAEEQVVEITDEPELSADNSVEDVAVEDTSTEITVADDIEMAGTKSQDAAPVEEMVVVDTAVVEEAPAATALVADADGVRVVPADGAAPQVLANVALDSITYDPAGEVLLTGRAAGEGFVQVYVDNKPITTSRITPSGDWRTDLPEVDTGVYTLRIDEVDEDGTVVSRIETPFKREEPEAVAAVMAEETAQEDFKVAVRTVQPGSTLWAIAREQFGEGIMFVAVYEANKDLIRNPDLIYPGQVFRMPEVSE